MSISVWQRKPDVFKVTAVALPVTLLYSPLSWIYYVMVLIPVFLDARWNMKMFKVAVLLLMPASIALPAIGAEAWIQALFGMIFLLPILMLL